MKKLAAWLLVLGLTLMGCAQALPIEEEGGFTMVSPKEAMALMEQEQDYIILDVRTQEEYAGGHIPGAICLPNETIGSELPAELPDKDGLILVYCRSGNRSKQAARKLADMGYSRVVEFGGIQSWPGDVVTE